MGGWKGDMMGGWVEEENGLCLEWSLECECTKVAGDIHNGVICKLPTCKLYIGSH